MTTEPDLRTPEEWQKEMPELIVRDPDGWRGAGGRPWEDRISREEYLERRALSTVTGLPLPRPDYEAGEAAYQAHPGPANLAVHRLREAVDAATREQQERIEQLEEALASALAAFRETAHYGEPVRRSGWVAESTVNTWRAALGRPEAPAESDGELLARLGTDAVAWTREFALRYLNASAAVVAPGSYLHTWFANAIEAGRSAGYSEAKRETNPDWPVPETGYVRARDDKGLLYFHAGGSGMFGVPEGVDILDAGWKPLYVRKEDER